MVAVILVAGVLAQLVELPEARGVDATGRWSATAPMEAGRKSHSATALTGPACRGSAPPEYCGRVLVAGGSGGGTTAEMFDPPTETWLPTGSMHQARSRHTATLLDPPACHRPIPPANYPCGQVLVVAGELTALGAPPTAEVYDPAFVDPGTGLLGRWAPTADPLALRLQLFGHQAVLLAGPECAEADTPAYCGQVLLLGGQYLPGLVSGAGTPRLDTAQLFDPVSGSWSLTSPMTTARGYPSAVMISTGQVLVIGGDATGRTAEIYDPATRAWTPTGPLATDLERNCDFAACQLAVPLDTNPCGSNCGKVLVVGGRGPDRTSTQIYDPATRLWRGLDSLAPHSPLWGAAVVLPSGKVLLAGGAVAGVAAQGPSSAFAATAIFDPVVTEQWAPGEPLSEPRAFATATLVEGPRCGTLCGTVLTAGGWNEEDGEGLTAEVYDPSSVSAAPTVTAMTPQVGPIGGGTELVLKGRRFEGLLRVNFGERSVACPSSGCRLEDQDGDRGPRTVVVAPPAPAGIVDVTVTTQTGTSRPLPQTRFTYVDAIGTWRKTDPLAELRKAHTVTLLTGPRCVPHCGKVLAVGGKQYPVSAERFDPNVEPNPWETTTPPPTPGFDSHTATLIEGTACGANCGKVLFAGGYAELQAGAACGVVRTEASHSPRCTAELYDPGADTWSSTGPLATPRRGHTATLLPSGRVLVVAGAESGGDPMGSAELYDPTTGSWSPAGNLAEPRSGHTATLIDGASCGGDPSPPYCVLVLGGYGPDRKPLASSELYDPTTGAWQPAGRLRTERQDHTAVVVQGARCATAAASTPCGKVLVAGGHGPSGNLSSAEVFDVVAGASRPTSPLSFSRSSHTVTALDTGRILVTGGTPSSGPLETAEIYDPMSGSWHATRSMVTYPTGQTATLLADGRVLVTGADAQDRDRSSVELFDEGVPSRPTVLGLSRRSGTTIGGEELTISGTGLFPVQEVHFGDIAVSGASILGNSSRQVVVRTPPHPRGEVTVTVSVEHHRSVASRAARFSFGSGAWGPAPGLADCGTGASSCASRFAHTATLLDPPGCRGPAPPPGYPCGAVLVAGGSDSDLLHAALASAELYDPATGTWRPAASMGEGRMVHTATLMPDGKVLVVGGMDDLAGLTSAEVYDPAAKGGAGSWAPAGRLLVARVGHTATPLPDGRVLVAGGSPSETGRDRTYDTAELYDPVTRSWRIGPPMAIGRSAHSATALPSGEVLVVGGLTGPKENVTSQDRDTSLVTRPAGGLTGAFAASAAEIFDPRGDVWRRTAPLAVARWDHSATVLPDGRDRKSVV